MNSLEEENTQRQFLLMCQVESWNWSSDKYQSIDQDLDIHIFRSTRLIFLTETKSPSESWNIYREMINGESLLLLVHMF